MEKSISKLISVGCTLYVASIPSINDLIINLLYKKFNVDISIPNFNLCFIFGTVCFVIAAFLTLKFYKKSKTIALLGLDNSNEINKLNDVVPVNIISEVKELNVINSNKIIGKYIERLNEIKRDYGHKELSYYGIMPLPFVGIAGLLFRKIDFRNHFEYWQKNDKIKRLSITPYILCPKLKITAKTMNSKVSILAIAITSTINEIDLKQFNGCNLYYAEIKTKKTNAIYSEEQLNCYAEKIADLIYEISKNYTEKIYIVPCCQSSLIFEIFKKINVNRISEIVICNYSKNSDFCYNWGISIKNHTYKYIELGEINGTDRN